MLFIYPSIFIYNPIYRDMVRISCLSIILKHVMIGQKLHDNEVRESVSTERGGTTLSPHAAETGKEGDFV